MWACSAGEEKVREKVKEGSYCCFQLKQGYREDKAKLSLEVHSKESEATVICMDKHLHTENG